MEFKRVWSRGMLGSVAALGVVLALAGCGGGQVEPFDPDRILVFGDEASLLTADGHNYAINGMVDADLDGDGKKDERKFDCRENKIWIQYLADGYNIGFPECTGEDTEGKERGHIMAAVNATAADVKQQVADFGEDNLKNRDLVLMVAGTHDVLELYRRKYPADDSIDPEVSTTDLADEADRRGEQFAELVSRVANLGPPVITYTIPDISLSPFAHKEKKKADGDKRVALLKNLVAEYNGAFLVHVPLNGRLIGLAFGDVESQGAVEHPDRHGYGNVDGATCLPSAPVPTCTDDTLVKDGHAFQWLWADDIHFSNGLHRRMGQLTLSVAKNNPF